MISGSRMDRFTRRWRQSAQEPLLEAYRIPEKIKRRERVEEIFQSTLRESGAEDEPSQKMVKMAFEDLDRKLIRRLILESTEKD